MDIWRWVETTTKALRRAGNDRLAELLDALPGLVCDEEDARVEALVPEALIYGVESGTWTLTAKIYHPPILPLPPM